MFQKNPVKIVSAPNPAVAIPQNRMEIIFCFLTLGLSPENDRPTKFFINISKAVKAANPKIPTTNPLYSYKNIFPTVFQSFEYTA